MVLEISPGALDLASGAARLVFVDLQSVDSSCIPIRPLSADSAARGGTVQRVTHPHMAVAPMVWSLAVRRQAFVTVPVVAERTGGGAKLVAELVAELAVAVVDLAATAELVTEMAVQATDSVAVPVVAGAEAKDLGAELATAEERGW